MAITKITTVRDRLKRVNQIGLDEINFGVITDEGLEHIGVYQEVLNLLDAMKVSIREAFKNAEEQSSIEAGTAAWNKLLAHYDGNVALALAAMGLNTDLTFVDSSAKKSDGDSKELIEDLTDSDNSTLDNSDSITDVDGDNYSVTDSSYDSQSRTY